MNSCLLGLLWKNPDFFCIEPKCLNSTKWKQTSARHFLGGNFSKFLRTLHLFDLKFYGLHSSSPRFSSDFLGKRLNAKSNGFKLQILCIVKFISSYHLGSTMPLMYRLSISGVSWTKNWALLRWSPFACAFWNQKNIFTKIETFRNKFIAITKKFNFFSTHFNCSTFVNKRLCHIELRTQVFLCQCHWLCAPYLQPKSLENIKFRSGDISIIYIQWILSTLSTPNILFLSSTNAHALSHPYDECDHYTTQSSTQ